MSPVITHPSLLSTVPSPGAMEQERQLAAVSWKGSDLEGEKMRKSLTVSMQTLMFWEWALRFQARSCQHLKPSHQRVPELGGSEIRFRLPLSASTLPLHGLSRYELVQVQASMSRSVPS